MLKSPAEIAKENARRILDAFRSARVAESDLWGSTGYGLDDIGRDKLEAVYASYFGTESALVRPQIVSGTHAAYLIAKALNMKSGRTAFYPSEPYESVLHNIEHDVAENLLWDGKSPVKARFLWLQRSGGYSWSQGLNASEMLSAIKLFKTFNPEALVIVDNCYGEFVEDVEPTVLGADLAFGSLIKNPGGTVTSTGAYVVGRAKFVDMVADTLYGPALGAQQGSTGNFIREALQGMFLGQVLTYNAVLGKLILLEQLPNVMKERYPFSDIIVRTKWSNKETLLKATKVVQSQGPINAHVSPEPFTMPGYRNPIIMAWTGFIQGESLSMSADGEFADPYMLFIQPGINTFSAQLLAEQLRLLT